MLAQTGRNTFGIAQTAAKSFKIVETGSPEPKDPTEHPQTHTRRSEAEGASASRRALGPNKRGCKKRGCKSQNCGKKQHWPNLYNIGRMCATSTKYVGNKRRCKSIAFAKYAEICAKFTPPLCYGAFRSCRKGWWLHDSMGAHSSCGRQAVLAPYKGLTTISMYCWLIGVTRNMFLFGVTLSDISQTMNDTE